MANRTRTDNVDLVPAAEPAGATYDRDFYTWSPEQAPGLVREGRWDTRRPRERGCREIGIARGASSSTTFRRAPRVS